MSVDPSPQHKSGRPLRILVVAQYYPPEITAAAFRWKALAEAWAHAGVDVTILTCFPNYPSGRIEEAYRHQHHLLERRNHVWIERIWTVPASDRGLIRRTISNFFFYAAGRGVASRLRPFDIVVGTSPPLHAAELAAHLAKSRGVPFVMEVRDLWPDVIFDSGYSTLAPLSRPLYAWESALYRRASHVVAVTTPFVPLLEAKGLRRNKISVMPPGIEFSDSEPVEAASELREQLGLTGKTVVMYLGNHGASQGLDTVVEAAALVSGSLHFLFVGNGWAKVDLRHRSEELGLKNITFIDAVPREKVEAYYEIADVCLVTLRPSELLQHFLPSKLIEVLAHGKHVLTNIGGEGADLVRDANAGVVLDTYAPETVAKALSSWRAEELAIPSDIRQRVRARYDLKDIAADYLALLWRVARRIQ